MEASLNINALFGQPSEPGIKNEKIFNKAALLYEFDLKTDFDKFSNAEIDLLRNKAHLKNNGRYILPEDLRAKIINEDIGINKIVDAIHENEVKSEFSETLLKIFNTKKTDYKLFSDSELFYLTKITDLLPGKLNLDEIKIELQRRYYFAPFKKITTNFAGRNKELGQIADYVDWLPKTSLLTKTIGFIRNIINWHDKPPLLIQGIGGIGKSTLISKFLIDHNNEKDGKSLPFVYIDFDLPGFTLTEPISILLECLRQLSIQFSQHQKVFSEISQNISELVFFSNNTNNQTFQTTTQSSRGLVFDSTEQLIRKYSWGLEKINTPVLIVFDSFEEMQYRASRMQMNNFFNFIKEISEKIPRIRPIFVGRSEISESVLDFKFEKIELPEFDIESSTVLLNNYGINNDNVCKQIHSTFGGNPLLLLLAADLMKKDKNAVNDFEQIKGKKQEYLVNRILDQIHDPCVRKIAVPGILLRTITPDVIQKILAKPCNLGVISDGDAEIIFENLRKETALISMSFDGNQLIFRQDLRIACEKMIWEQFPHESERIRQKAIKYYRKKKSESYTCEAEYYYHVLKSGKIPEELDRNVYDRIRSQIETSLIELPEKAQLYIKSLTGSQVSESIINQSTIIEWENYYLSQIKKGLNGEFGFLKQLYKELNNRDERSQNPDSCFPIFEALLYQRLNKLKQSNEVINQAIELKNESNDIISYELRLINAQNLEYGGHYIDALALCEKNFYELSDSSNDILFQKNNFLKLRLANRCGARENYLLPDLSGLKFPLDEEFVDTHWYYIFKTNYEFDFKQAEVFTRSYNYYVDSIRNFLELEKLCQANLGVFLKDIALSGEFEIVLRDFLYVMESKQNQNKMKF